MAGRTSTHTLALIGMAMLGGLSSTTHAAVVGSAATLMMNYHNVGGTVTITDADTFRVDDFTYDGGGPYVFFYLGTEQTSAAFGSGLAIEPMLTTGTSYDGSQGALYYDLPAGETFDNYNAISVWCAEFHVDFGSGTFVAPALPGDLNGDGYVGLDDLQPILDHWNQNVTIGDASMGDIAGPGGTGPDGYVGLDDLQPVLDHWNEGTLPTPPSTVPEPAGLLVLGLPVLLLKRKISGR